MKTHNASIYHCISCGRVVHTELETEPPQCCGRAMSKAAAETIREGDVTGPETGGPHDAKPPVNKGPAKPR